VYNIALGRYTRRVEHELYRALAEEWGEDGGHVVMKGLTVEQVAMELRRKWDKFKCPIAVSIDASRFDQHVSVGALKWEHSIYKRLFGYSPELCSLLSIQLRNEGFAYVDGVKVSYRVDGTRASGDMNTSLGNCLIMCSLVREYVRDLGINAELANNGDDCVIFMEAADFHKLDGMVPWFLRYGFEMGVDKIAEVFEEVEFCQTQPVYTHGGWVMVRQPEVALGKDALGLGVRNEAEYRQWCYQVGVGGHALYGDMPIYGALYNMYQRCGTQSKCDNSLLFSDSGFMRMSKHPRVRGSDQLEPSGATRVSFFKAFGIAPSAQVRLEKDLALHSFAGISKVSHNPSIALGLTLA
jgi:hypothetical protein